MAVLPPMLWPMTVAPVKPWREEGAHVFRHLAVVHGLRPGRGAVVAQIDREDPVHLAEPPRDACPVVARAEQAMQDDERRPLARFGVSQFQRHVRVFVRSGLEQFPNSAQNWTQGLISRAPGPRSGVAHRWARSVSAQV